MFADIHFSLFDILVGDQDGVVIVPRKSAAEVVEELKKVLAKEKQMDTAVKAGNTVPAWLEEAKKIKGVRYID